MRFHRLLNQLSHWQSLVEIANILLFILDGLFSDSEYRRLNRYTKKLP